MSDDEVFDEAHIGMHTHPASGGSLKKGDHLLIKGHPCKIVELTTSKTGKHGHAKANITAIDIITGAKLEDSIPTSHNVEVPNITKIELELISIDQNNFCTVLTEDGEYREDLKLPKEEDNMWVKSLKETFENGKNILVTILNVLGQDHIISFREDVKK